MKALLAALPVAFAAISSTQPQLFDSEHMLETFKAIAAQKVAQGGDINKETKNNIGAILRLIDDKLTVALTKDYDLAIENYNREVANLEKCNTDAQKCKVDEPDDQLVTYLDAKAQHGYCRAFEHEVCHYNKEDCEDVHKKVKGFNLPVWGNNECDDETCGSDCNGPVCKWMNDAKHFVETYGPGCSSSNHDDCYFNEDAGKDDKGCTLKERKATECSRDERVGGGARLNGTRYEGCDYASWRSNCLYATELRVQQATLCRDIQKKAEAAHYDFRDEGCDCCKVFLDNWQEKTELLIAENTTVVQTISLIRKQAEALECLVCYGNKILEAGSDDLSECERREIPCDRFPFPSSVTKPNWGNQAACNAHMHGAYPAIDVSFVATKLNDDCPLTQPGPVIVPPTPVCLDKGPNADPVSISTECDVENEGEPENPTTKKPSPETPEGEKKPSPSPSPEPEGEGETPEPPASKKPTTTAAPSKKPPSTEGEESTPEPEGEGEGEPKKPTTTAPPATTPKKPIGGDGKEGEDNPGEPEAER